MGGSVYLKRLWSGFDTLEITWSGAVFEPWQGLLDGAKVNARDTLRSNAVRLGGECLYVQRSGLKPWAWVLVGPDYHLRLGRGAPAASCRLLSVGLTAHGPERLVARVERVLESVGAFGRPRVSRADVAMDFQGWVPGAGTMTRSVVCPASFRPVYPSIEAPETFQFGRGAVVARVYNKSAEVRAKPSHWPSYWSSCEAYSAERDVWRVEFQYRRDALRELGVVTPDDALSSARGLMEYGLRWCSVRKRTGDSNVRRRPVHPAWEQIGAFFSVSEPLQRVLDGPGEGGAVALVPQISGLLVSVGAHLGIKCPRRATDWVLKAMGELHAERACDYESLVADRQVSLYGATTPDGLSPNWGFLGL